MGAPRFRTLRKFLGPRWLTEGEGGLVGYSLDVVVDDFVTRLLMGLLARFPQNGPNGETAPDDALAATGRDRRETRGLNESSASYASHLLTWLDDRRRQGNPFMLMQKLAQYLGPLPSFRTVDARGNWFSRAADGTETALLKQENWDWDGTVIGERWSRFWVIIYPNGLWSEHPFDWGDTAGPGWGEGTDTAGLTLGTSATSEHVNTVRSLVADWMGTGRCINIIVAFDPNSFDPTAPEPDGLWERWSKNVGGVQVPARLDTARYWEGVTR